MQVADAGDPLRFEQAEQLHDALVCFECDPIAEVHEQRFIARRLELWLHAKEEYKALPGALWRGYTEDE